MHHHPKQRRPGHLPQLKGNSRGVVLVEFAILLPLLVLLALGILEIGRAIMVRQIMVNSAREGVRAAAQRNSTQTAAFQAVDDTMNAGDLNTFTRQVSPDPATSGPNSDITVTVSLPYNDISWLPVSTLTWMDGKTLTVTATMRKEP